MSTIEQTPRKDESRGGIAGFIQSSFRTGLGIAENMHQFAVEIPLNMLQGIGGVSKEKNTELKDKHRNLLRGMYGSIDSITSRLVETGEDQAENLAAGIRDLVDDGTQLVGELAEEKEKTTVGSK